MSPWMKLRVHFFKAFCDLLCDLVTHYCFICVFIFTEMSQKLHKLYYKIYIWKPKVRGFNATPKAKAFNELSDCSVTLPLKGHFSFCCCSAVKTVPREGSGSAMGDFSQCLSAEPKLSCSPSSAVLNVNLGSPLKLSKAINQRAHYNHADGSHFDLIGVRRAPITCIFHFI